MSLSEKKGVWTTNELANESRVQGYKETTIRQTMWQSPPKLSLRSSRSELWQSLKISTMAECCKDWNNETTTGQDEKQLCHFEASREICFVQSGKIPNLGMVSMKLMNNVKLSLFRPYP